MPFVVLDYTQFMFVNNEHNEIAVVVTCIANSSLSSHAHASHQSHASKNQESRDDQREYILQNDHHTCSIQPILRSSKHQSNEVSSVEDPAPNESRRVGQEGELKQWCVVRSEAGRALVAVAEVDTPTLLRESE